MIVFRRRNTSFFYRHLVFNSEFSAINTKFKSKTWKDRHLMQFVATKALQIAWYVQCCVHNVKAKGLCPSRPHLHICFSATRHKHLSAPNTVANVRHVWLEESAVRAMWKKLSLRSDGDGSGRKKCKGGYSGGLEGYTFGRIPKSGVRFCVGDLAKIWLQMFSHLICFMKKFYECYTFNAIFKDNAAIRVITVRQKG